MRNVKVGKRQMLAGNHMSERLHNLCSYVRTPFNFVFCILLPYMYVLYGSLHNYAELLLKLKCTFNVYPHEYARPSESSYVLYIYYYLYISIVYYTYCVGVFYIISVLNHAQLQPQLLRQIQKQMFLRRILFLIYSCCYTLVT